MLNPRLGRAFARALLPVAVLAGPTVINLESAHATTVVALAAPTVVTTTNTPALATKIPTAVVSAATLARRAALAKGAAHRALVLRRNTAVVKWALRHVGARYVAGASGPWAFDCSGLTLAAWRTQGIYLPHLSRAQYNVLKHVSLSQLRPGDLLFYFRSGAHHVALYVGHGKMVSADDPKQGVKLDSIYLGWFVRHLTGAARVLR